MQRLENTCEDLHGIEPWDELPRPPDTVVAGFVGATASGKTALSLEFAKRVQEELGIQPEVICIDKKTTRRDSTTTTAAPTEAERAGFPHHMLDIFDAVDNMTPRWTYQAMARACLRDIASRGRLPLLVGGSVHLMEALVYYPGFVPLGNKEGKDELKDLSLDELRIVSLIEGWGGPFEDNPRRWANHILARRALERPLNTDPLPGTLLFGVHRYRDELKERIRIRTERIFPAIVREFGGLGKHSNGIVPVEVVQTIGFGDFWEHINKGRHPAQSIYERTLELADWQTIEIEQWMAGIRWIRSADEAVEKFKEHLETHPIGA